MTKNFTYQYLIDSESWPEIYVAIKNKVNPDTLKNEQGLTPVGRAVLNESTVILTNLLSLGQNPNPFPLKNGVLYSPLWASLYRNYENHVETLLKYDADPNISDYETGQPPLYYSSIKNMYQASMALINHGAKTDPVWDSKSLQESPMHIWIKNIAKNTIDGNNYEQIKILDAFLKHNVKLNTYNKEKLNIIESIEENLPHILNSNNQYIKQEMARIKIIIEKRMIYEKELSKINLEEHKDKKRL